MDITKTHTHTPIPALFFTASSFYYVFFSFFSPGYGMLCEFLMRWCCHSSQLFMEKFQPDCRLAGKWEGRGGGVQDEQYEAERLKVSCCAVDACVLPIKITECIISVSPAFNCFSLQRSEQKVTLDTYSNKRQTYSKSTVSLHWLDLSDQLTAHSCLYHYMIITNSLPTLFIDGFGTMEKCHADYSSTWWTVKPA